MSEVVAFHTYYKGRCVHGCQNNFYATYLSVPRLSFVPTARQEPRRRRETRGSIQDERWQGVQMGGK
jgi:hypothetical protein